MINNLNAKIYIAGHKGMVGSATWKVLKSKGYNNLIGFTSSELDLTNQAAVFDMIKKEKPDAIVDSAAKVGGIMANSSQPYEFLMENMLIQNNLLKAAHELDVQKFIFLGSSCIYPKMAPQPIKEEHLLTGPLEDTNQWYSIAKISGIKIVEALRKQYNRDYVSLMPTNLYGPGDNFDFQTSHVFPALIRKFDYAKKNQNSQVILWGTGKPKREFLHVDELASVILFALENKLEEPLYNVGSGDEISIRELARLMKKIIRYEGEIIWDKTKPDGTPRKLLDSSKIKSIKCFSSVDLEIGIKDTYEYFLKYEN